jgi:GntR family transcriptional regulator
LKVIAEEESVVRRENYYYADDEPVQIVVTYVRWSDAEGTALLEPKAGVGGIYGRLEDKGHIMTSGQDDVIARMPTPEEAKFFKFSPSTPVLDVTHTSYDQDGEPFEMSRFVHRGDRHGLRYTFGVD